MNEQAVCELSRTVDEKVEQTVGRWAELKVGELVEQEILEVSETVGE